jgi:TatD DNase family protein
MIHVRPTDKINYDAYKDTLDILEDYATKYGGKLHGNAHFFVGNKEILKRFLEIGFTISFAGVITFAREYDEVVRFVPLDMLMSETDSPFVVPVPFRGKRNSPLYVPEIVTKIAEIRNESIITVKTALVSNALRHFSITSSVAS